MAIPITIPRLGWDMVEGVFVGWIKADGDAVHAGEALFTLESDKSTEDIECFDNGVLSIAPNGPKKGDKIAVGTVIGHIVQDGEAGPVSSAPAQTAVEATATSSRAEAQRVARPASSNKVAASPRARRIAAELGVDWSKLQGTGRTGRIRERDVRAHFAQRAAQPSAASSAQPVSSMRRTIAEHMLHSHHATAPVTLTTTVDAGNLVNLRAQAKAAVQAGNDFVPGFTDMIVKLTATALDKHRLLNASWVNEQIVIAEAIHIGIAVELDEGLVVPVLRDVKALGLREVASRSRDLIERARQRKLKAEEMRSGTFTVTNLGAFGIDAFTPIIHHPQCAILGVGRIQKRPVVVEQTESPAQQIAIRDQMTLSLTFDHRVVDGAPAARFLQTLAAMIENPGPWLMT